MIQGLWGIIAEETIDALPRSFRHRCEIVIVADGGSL
jgi:hypothetical protein